MSITLARTIEISEDGHVTANPPLTARNRRATPIFFEVMEEWNSKVKPSLNVDVEKDFPVVDPPAPSAAGAPMLAAKKTTKKKVSVQGTTPENAVVVVQQTTDKALQETLDAAAAAARRIPSRNKQR